jgi:hypothetical protein
MGLIQLSTIPHAPSIYSSHVLPVCLLACALSIDTAVVPIPVSVMTPSSIASVSLVNPLPMNVTEGPKGAMSVSVLVKNAAGDPLSGRYCFTKVVAVHGVKWPYIHSQVLDTDTKTIQNAISGASNSAGIATFSDLYFGWIGKNGNYSLEFICEDVATTTHVIYVQSRVHTVSVVEPVAWSAEQADGTLQFRLPSGVTATEKKSMPIFVISDIDGNPVPGRRLTVTDQGGLSNIRITSDLSDENGIVYVFTFQVLKISPLFIICFQPITHCLCHVLPRLY